MPSITCRAPTHTTAAVPSAIEHADRARVHALQGVQPPAGGQARPLAAMKRRCSSSSRVNAWITRIADIERCDERVHLAVAVARDLRRRG